MNRGNVATTASFLALLLALVLVAQDKTIPMLQTNPDTKQLSLFTGNMRVANKRVFKSMTVNTEGFSEARLMISLTALSSAQANTFGKSATGILSATGLWIGGAGGVSTSYEQLQIAGKGQVLMIHDVKIRSDKTQFAIHLNELEGLEVVIGAEVYLIK